MARARGGAPRSLENSAGPIGPSRPPPLLRGPRCGAPLELWHRPSEGSAGPRKAPCSSWTISEFGGPSLE
eukprot:3276383-Alexandrium_andersonii.AAC.1